MLVHLDWETACLSKPAFNVFVSLQRNNSVGMKEGLAGRWDMARAEEIS